MAPTESNEVSNVAKSPTAPFMGAYPFTKNTPEYEGLLAETVADELRIVTVASVPISG